MCALSCPETALKLRNPDSLNLDPLCLSTPTVHLKQQPNLPHFAGLSHKFARINLKQRLARFNYNVQRLEDALPCPALSRVISLQAAFRRRPLVLPRDGLQTRRKRALVVCALWLFMGFRVLRPSVPIPLTYLFAMWVVLRDVVS